MKQKELEKLKKLPDRQCKNCTFVYDGFFCPRCGQRYMEGRYNLKESSQWVMDQVLNLDKGFFYTIWELLLHPGKIINDYLKKATVRYMHPFRFAFIIASLSALITIMSGAFESPDLNAFAGVQQDEVQMELLEEVMEVFQRFLSIILLASIPFYALGSAIVYSYKQLNYAEHLIVNCYAYGLTLILGLPLTILVLFPNGLMWNSFLSTIVTFISFAWVYCSTFKENYLMSLLKSLVVTLIAILASIIMAVIIVVIVVIFK